MGRLFLADSGFAKVNPGGSRRRRASGGKLAEAAQRCNAYGRRAARWPRRRSLESSRDSKTSVPRPKVGPPAAGLLLSPPFEAAASPQGGIETCWRPVAKGKSDVGGLMIVGRISGWFLLFFALVLLGWDAVSSDRTSTRLNSSH